MRRASSRVRSFAPRGVRATVSARALNVAAFNSQVGFGRHDGARPQNRGGPQKYTGRSMKDSHQHLMITATEWEAFLDDLQQTLDNFAVPQAEQAEIKAIVASTRADIVV